MGSVVIELVLTLQSQGNYSVLASTEWERV